MHVQPRPGIPQLGKDAGLCFRPVQFVKRLYRALWTRIIISFPTVEDRFEHRDQLTRGGERGRKARDSDVNQSIGLHSGA